MDQTAEIPYKQDLKVVVVGDGAVGKTCLIITQTEKFYPGYHEHGAGYAADKRLGNLYTNMLVDKIQFKLTFWDTPGQEEFDRLRPLAYPDTDVFIICYCVDRPSSLRNIKLKWVPEIRKYCPRTPIIISGNKDDLRDECTGVWLELVPFDEAQQIGQEVGAEAVLECSAKRQTGLARLFEHAVRATMLTPGYNQTSRRDKRCKRCGSLSKESCYCEHTLRKIRIRKYTPVAVRQWCRIFSTPTRFLRRASGEQKMLVNFFAQRPGLKKLVGGLVARFYDPRTAPSFDRGNTKCVVM